MDLAGFPCGAPEPGCERAGERGLAVRVRGAGVPGRGRDRLHWWVGVCVLSKHLGVSFLGSACHLNDPQHTIPQHTGRSRVDLLVVLTPQAFHRLAGKAPNIARLGEIDCRGIIATCRGGVGAAPERGQGEQQQQQQRFDFVSRFFGPRCGIAEDPGTCALCVMWWVEVGHRRILITPLARKPQTLSSHGQRALLPGRVLGKGAGQDLAASVPGFQAGRGAARRAGRGAGPGAVGRPGRAGQAWGAGVLMCWVVGVE